MQQGNHKAGQHCLQSLGSVALSNSEPFELHRIGLVAQQTKLVARSNSERGGRQWRREMNVRSRSRPSFQRLQGETGRPRVHNNKSLIRVARAPEVAGMWPELRRLGQTARPLHIFDRPAFILLALTYAVVYLSPLRLWPESVTRLRRDSAAAHRRSLVRFWIFNSSEDREKLELDFQLVSGCHLAVSPRVLLVV